MVAETWKIGTRGSPLALRQSNWVADRIRERRPGVTVTLVPIRTKGDILQEVPLAQVGGKGLFIREIEEALLAGEVDLAVHSMKDLPAELPEGLEIAATPTREDPRDVLIGRDGRELEELPAGARIGTGSLRRALQLRRRLPHLQIVPLRGNLETRIGKIEREGLDGVILAAAGLRRMGWAGRITQFLPPAVMVPAVGQGVLGIEIRRRDGALKEALAFLHDPGTWCEVSAERAFLRELGGGCQLPVAGFAQRTEGTLAVTGLIGSVDGRRMIGHRVEGPAGACEALGRELAAVLLARGGRALLDEVYREGGA